MPFVTDDTSNELVHPSTETLLRSLATLHLPTAGSLAPLQYRSALGVVVRNLHANGYGFAEEEVQDLVLEALRHLLSPNHGPSAGMPGFLFSKNVSLVTDIRVPGGTPGMDTRVNKVLRWLVEHARADEGKKRQDFGTARVEKPDIVLIGRSDLPIKTSLSGSTSRRSTGTALSGIDTSTPASTASTGSRKRSSSELSRAEDGKRRRRERERERDPELAVFMHSSASMYWAAEWLKFEVKLHHFDMILGQTQCYALIGFETCGSRAALLLYRTRFTPVLVLDDRTIALETSQQDRRGHVEDVAAWRANGAIKEPWLPHDLDKLNRAKSVDEQRSAAIRKGNKDKGNGTETETKTKTQTQTKAMLALQDPNSIPSERPLFLQLPFADLVHLPSLEQFTRFVVSWIHIAAPIDLDARLDWQALQARNSTGLTTLSLATKLTATRLPRDLLSAYHVRTDPCYSRVDSTAAPDDDDDGHDDHGWGMGPVRGDLGEGSAPLRRRNESRVADGDGNGHEDHNHGPPGGDGADRVHKEEGKDMKRKGGDGRSRSNGSEQHPAAGSGYTTQTRQVQGHRLESAAADSEPSAVPDKYQYRYNLGVWLRAQRDVDSDLDADSDPESEADPDTNRRPDAATMMRLQKTLTPGRMYWAALELLGIRVRWVRPGGLVEEAERMVMAAAATQVWAKEARAHRHFNDNAHVRIIDGD